MGTWGTWTKQNWDPTKRVKLGAGEGRPKDDEDDDGGQPLAKKMTSFMNEPEFYVKMLLTKKERQNRRKKPQINKFSKTSRKGAGLKCKK